MQFVNTVNLDDADVIFPAERLEQCQVDVQCDVTGRVLGQYAQQDSVSCPARHTTGTLTSATVSNSCPAH